MTDIEQTLGARILADRTARTMSRSAYAALTGLTAAKIANLEKGRKPKPDELEKLAHLAFTPTPEAEATAPITPGEAPPITPEPQDPTVLTPEAVIARYTEVYHRLGGKPAAIGYHGAWGTPGQGDPQFFPHIMKWCDEVDEWLNLVRDVHTEEPLPDVTVTVNGEEVEATVETRPDDTEPGTAIGGFITEDDFIAGDEDEEIAAEEDYLASVVDEWTVPDDGLRRISNGELKTFKRCRRKWWLAYYRRLGLPVHAATGAAQLGTRIHRCLAVYYVPKGQAPGDPFAELERTIAEDLAIIGGDEFKVADLMKEKDLAHAMLEGYFEWLAETAADQGIEVVAPETKIEVNPNMPGHENVRLIGKIDVRAVRTFGTDVARLVVDHKTVADLTTPTKMLAFDEQMLMYHLLEYLDLLQSGVSDDEAQAVRTDGALYNMLRKVKRTATAKPPFYGRVEVRHNIETLRSYWLRVLGTLDEITALEAKLAAGHDPRQVAYPTPTRDCSWECEAYAVCTMFDDGSRAEDMLAGTFVAINPLARYETNNEGKTL